MNNDFEKATREEIRALCDEIAVAHDLDDELREELRGHVEDKVLAYLNGDVAVSEADAVILAREHFGDRRRLKELLSDVHHVESNVSLLRRIVAAAIVTFCARFVTEITQAILLGSIAFITNLMEGNGSVDQINIWWFYLTSPVTTVVLWLSLARMRRQPNRGLSRWFQRCPAWNLVTAVAVILALLPFVQATQVFLLRYLPFSMTVATVYTEAVIRLVSGVSGVVTVLLWLWWCDSRPRRVSPLLLTAMGWTLYASWPLFALLTFVSASNGGLPGMQQVQLLGGKFLTAAALAGLGCCVYRLAVWAAEKRRGRVVEQ